MLKYLLYNILRLKWFFFAITLMIVIAGLSPPAGLNSRAMAVIGITCMAIVLFVSAAIPLPATALLVAFFQVLYGVGRPNQIARTFTGDAMFFILGILLIANVLIQQNIDKRLSRMLLRFTGLKVSRLVFGMMILCALLGAVIGEHTAAALLFPVSLSIIMLSSNDETEREKFGKVLLIALAFSSMVGGMATPSGGGRNPLMIEYLWKLSDIKVGYLQWVIMIFPVAMLLLIPLFFLIRITFRTSIKELPEKTINSALRNSEVSEKLLPREKLTIMIFAVILFLWIFGSERIGMGVIALFGVFLYILFGLTTWRDISKKTNWGIILIYASSLSLGLAMKHTGVTNWFANGITEVLYNLHITQKPVIYGSIAMTSALMGDILSHGPSVAVSGPIFIRLAEVAKMNVLLVGLLNAMASSFGFLTIIAAPANSLIYTSGYIKTTDFIKIGWIATIVLVFLMTVISLFYWNILGYNL